MDQLELKIRPKPQATPGPIHRPGLRTDPLYTPPDMILAAERFGANCGPSSLAAVLRRPVVDTMQLLLTRWPGYTSPTKIRETLERLRLAYCLTARCPPEDDPDGVPKGSRYLPVYGLATVQISGPWEERSVQESYGHTHVIGAADRDGHQIYDCNAFDGAGGWMPILEWRRMVMQEILGCHPGATGYWIRWAVEVG